MRATESMAVAPAPSQLVSIDGDHLWTDSRIVAKFFGKRHDNVLRAYDKLQCSEKFNHLNFEAVESVDAKGQVRRGVRMTKDGFTMLAMGFTGPRAMQFKEDYINAFNAMAEQVAHMEKTLTKRMLDLIAKETRSEVKATLGSRLMHGRRRELKPLRKERLELESVIQPTLSFH